MIGRYFVRKARRKASAIRYVFEKELEMQKDDKGADRGSAAEKRERNVKAKVERELETGSLPVRV